jgi:hypothetical protein
MTLISAVSRVGASADRIIPQVDRTGAAGNLHIPLWVMHTSPLQPAGLCGDPDRLHPVTAAELGDRGRQVVPDGPVGQEQLRRDLGRLSAGREPPPERLAPCAATLRRSAAEPGRAHDSSTLLCASGARRAYRCVVA